MHLNITLQRYLPQHAITRFFGWIANVRTPWFKNWAIRTFANLFGVDWQAAQYERPEDYENFNAFFSRKLKPGLRPLAPLPALISPVDGFISEIGYIKANTFFQAKGHTYTLSELLANQHAMENAFENGAFATLYLSPKDYHRVHIPLSARLLSMTFVPGSLFSVNATTVTQCDRLFARNERLICYFETDLGPMALILVAALNVGSMFTPWHGIVKANGIYTWDYSDKTLVLERGDEIGGFLMGSTAILLLPHNTVTWEKEMGPGDVLKLGQAIGSLNNSKP